MRIGIISIAVFVLLASCSRDTDRKGKPLSTPTSGKTTIVADESLQPLIEAQIDVFNNTYKKADIDAIYSPEIDAMDLFMKDSVQIAVVTRSLRPDEFAYFKQLKISVDTTTVATGAIALIVNPANKDTVISVEQISKILKGEIKTWGELGGRSKNGIEIVFDNAKSSLVRYLKDSIAKVQTLPANCFAVENNMAVVERVANNVNALGLIGVEWVSDDPVSNKFLKQVKVMGVSGDTIPFKPYQAYMALKYYPLMRRIYVINRETRHGLGHGFASFFAGPTGQRIVLKSGLLPKTMPIRIIQVNPENFEVEK
jgi:phosphate transport system substrate-binding protein